MTAKQLCKAITSDICRVVFIFREWNILQRLIDNRINLLLFSRQHRLIWNELTLVVLELAAEALDYLLEQACLLILFLGHEVALLSTPGHEHVSLTSGYTISDKTWLQGWVAHSVCRASLYTRSEELGLTWSGRLSTCQSRAFTPFDWVHTYVRRRLDLIGETYDLLPPSRWHFFRFKVRDSYFQISNEYPLFFLINYIYFNIWI